jgi:hypothetical protein
MIRRLEKPVAKPKLEISLAPIAEQIGKVEKQLRALRPKVAVADRKRIDLDIADLKKLKKTIREVCKGRMTHGFSPA